MKLQVKIAAILGAIALVMAPAMALAAQPTNPGKGHGPKYTPAPPPGTPGPGAGLPEKAKAYGVHCQDQSKKHVAGERGTPFSQCVTAMAKAANNEKVSARKACKGMSKKHVKGEKGTPFSRCVKAAAQLKKELRASGATA
ncbi:MAG: hypothetical protein WA862_04970 [Solirubrobacterales bacterium]